MKTTKAFQLGLDQLRTMGSWMMWFVGIYAISYLAVLFIPDFFNLDWNIREIEWTFFHGMINSGKIFFLICGLLSLWTFIKYYVSNGMTRNDYFKGTMGAVVVLSLILTVIITIFSIVEWFFFSNMSTGFMALFLKAPLELVLYFLLGWFIGVGFYRYGIFAGLLSILLSFIVVIVHSEVWGEAGTIPWLEWLNLTTSVGVAVAINLFLIIVSAVVIRRMIKDMRIKI
ncbi:hypothetical protein [Alkalihalobacillus sp. 1P02AB]|uniref:hypothetical protein n=1 Tax=Alkalihalobacillus sp. 1P02AB TaxID=3132260 RepID=UPI0039A6A50F